MLMIQHSQCFPLQAFLRLGEELGQALSWQPAVRASRQRSFWNQTWNLHPAAPQQGWGGKKAREENTRRLPGNWQEVSNPWANGVRNSFRRQQKISSPGFASLKPSCGWASCWVSCHIADFCYTSPFYNLCETFYPSNSISSTVLWEWTCEWRSPVKMPHGHNSLFPFSS